MRPGRPAWPTAWLVGPLTGSDGVHRDWDTHKTIWRISVHQKRGLEYVDTVSFIHTENERQKQIYTVFMNMLSRSPILRPGSGVRSHPEPGTEWARVHGHRDRLWRGCGPVALHAAQSSLPPSGPAKATLSELHAISVVPLWDEPVRSDEGLETPPRGCASRSGRPRVRIQPLTIALLHVLAYRR